MSTAAVAEPTSASPPARRRRRPASELEFPGCEARPMTAAEYEAHEGRVEFYDFASGVAWMVCEPAGFGHATPSSKLDHLVEMIGQARGSAITCHGNAQLRGRDPESGQRESIHPDQIVYLRQDFEDPQRWRFLAVGEGPVPDVVVEVDHTTDVRGNRLQRYEEWGFPEVWVEVPDAPSPSRPRGRKSGLEIYLLEGERSVRSPVSRAFPGWRATEIHRALNERIVSAETEAVLYRVGRALGEPEGTGPEDNLWLRRFLDLGRAEGHARGRIEGRAEGRVEGHARGRIEGRAEGRAEGHASGRIEGRAATVATVARELLRQRGIELSARFPDDLGPSDRAALRRASPETVVAAATAGGSLADFLARLRAPDP